MAEFLSSLLGVAKAAFLLSLLGGVFRSLFSIISKLLAEASLKLISIIFKQFGLLVGVKKEKGALESKLQMIRRVIRCAEELQLEEERDFVEKFKGAAYDIEDLVDEFMAEALRQQVETRDGMLKKVCNFFSTSNPLVFCYKMIFMAHKIKALNKRIDAIVKKKDFDCAKLFGGHIPPTPVSQGRETCSYVIEDDVYGRHDDKAKLIDTLINSGNESNVSVIAIVGMGGMGKTTLAKLVFHDLSVVTHFNLRMWIYVSENFDVKRLLKEILQSASNNDTSEQLSMERLQMKLGEALREKKYLLVLDDVWHECRDKWLELESLLRCGAVGSKILVTTRSDKVALSMGTLQTLPLRELPEKECLYLFKKLAFGDKQELNENLVKIGEEIVRKCGGVPLAVRTVGSLMYSKESVREWEHVRDGESWLQDEDSGILPALRLSYNHLTPSLKECFAYCFVFPKGGNIDVDKLIKQWMAQGFIQSSEENELLEEKGEEYFKMLWSRSFFQDVKRNDDGDMISCRMHDRVRDLARAIAGNGFAFPGMHNQTIDLKKTRHLIMEYPTEVALKNIMKAFKIFEKMRSMFFVGMNSEVNICFRFWWLRLLDVCFRFLRLRLLDVRLRFWWLRPLDLCFRFRRLRLLDVSFSSTSHLPESIGKLKHLRYLDVSHTRIEELPETICNLFNLQTLILNGTGIKKLPKGMRRMISLRHVELKWYNEQMPNGIGELASLRTLPNFIIGEKSGCGIEELKLLNLLRGDFSIEGLENIKNAQCAHEASLKEKKYLRSLCLSYGKIGDTPEGNLENVIQCLEPHSGLERLTIKGYMGKKFPTWMEQINLVDLTLSNCKSCQHLPQLGRLCSLVSLSLERMDAIEYIVEFESGYDKGSIFPSLKRLEICNMCNLKGWSRVGGAGVLGPCEPDDQHFPRLCVLVVWDCPNLTNFPKGLGALERLTMIDAGCNKLEISSFLSLKELELSQMPNLEGLLSQQASSNDEQVKKAEVRVLLPFLLRLKISKCPKLTHMPALVLPALESFEIDAVGLHKVQLISSSLSLKTFKIIDMPDLESWSSQVDNGNDRQEKKSRRLDDAGLSGIIKECPKMIDMPRLLPSLHKLLIINSNERLLRSMAHYTSISSLILQGFPEMMSLPLHVFGLNHTNLHELIITDCPKVTSLSDWLENLPALKTLAIDKCPDLESILPNRWSISLQFLLIENSCKKQTVFPVGDGIVFHSLRRLDIEGWENLESLFEGLQQNLIPTLQELTISSCPNLVPFPNISQQQCLNSLKVLNIWDSCKKLTSFPGGGGDGIALSSLRELDIRGCENLEHLFEGLKEKHITSLEQLKIVHCPRLGNLPEWLGNLTSLKELVIGNCPSMNALPTKLQKSLIDKTLTIYDCPFLEGSIQRNDGG